MFVKARLLLLSLALLCAPAMAHHSNTMFYTTTPVTITGTVRAFQWRNPHTHILLQVTGERGRIDVWSIEMKAATDLFDLGWRRQTLIRGDRITVTVLPLRNGQPGGLAQEVLIEGKPAGGNAGAAENDTSLTNTAAEE